MEASNRKKFIKGVSSQTIITIIMGVLSILTFSLFSRLLSKEDFGYFAALSSILIVFQAFSDAGLGSAVIQVKKITTRYYSTAFNLSVIISSSMALLLFMSAGFWADIISDSTIIAPLRFFSIFLVLEGVQSIGASIMIRNLNFFKYGIFQIVSYVIGYGIGIWLAFLSYGLYALVIAALLNKILLVMLVFFSGVRFPKLIINRQDAKGILNFGGWLTASVLVNQLTQQLDKLVLGKWLSVTALGAYSRPSSFISQITERVNGIFDTTLFPILSSIQGEEEKIKDTFIRAVAVLNSFSSVLAALLFFNSPLIIQLFFGDDWMDLIPVFQIISIGVVLSIDQRLVDCFFRSLALVKQNFWLRFFCMFIVLSGLYIGVRHGIIGTALCVVIANIFVILIKVVFLCYSIKVEFLHFVRSLIISLKPVIFLVFVGVVYIKINIFDNLIINLLFAFVCAVVVLCEFLLFPSMVSKEYEHISKPYLDRVHFFLKCKK